MSYLKNVQTRTTSQSESVREDQVPNSAGGFTWQVDEWTRLRRFLILGSESGSYYAGERQLTLENFDALKRCVAEDGPRAVWLIAEISDQGLAPKNDQAIFALAYAFAHGNAETRKVAEKNIQNVCRIGTHIFQFVSFVQNFRGWGRSLRRAIGNWYLEKEPDQLAYQLLKYRQREGWSHRDLLRKAHPRTNSEDHKVLFDFVTHGYDGPGFFPEGSLPLLTGFIAAQNAGSPEHTADLIRSFSAEKVILTREMVKTEDLSSPVVWEALLEGMPLTAMLRNLGNMSKIGLLTPTSDATKKVLAELANEDRIRKSRLHPLTILNGMLTYSSGRGFRGKGSWNAVPQIVDALDAAFYLAFGNVKPTNKRWMLALDVSGSMEWDTIAGTQMTPRVAAAAMALVTANREPLYECVTFSSGGSFYQPSTRWRGNDGIEAFPISSRQRLDDVVQKTRGLFAGGTDCALPMLYAMQNNRNIDVFVIYTDSETWAGHIHPVQALEQYRQKTGINAKLITVGMVSNGFSIADPNDPGMLDCVGFDTNAPQIMSEFASDKI